MTQAVWLKDMLKSLEATLSGTFTLRHALSEELLRKAKLVELDRLKAEGRISEEAYKILREEYEEELKK